ncbi:MAG: hypothetical protein PHT07_23130 [Paludibacter sp.]|nr:hypothetical protein [Paludibacter sp.]
MNEIETILISIIIGLIGFGIYYWGYYNGKITGRYYGYVECYNDSIEIEKKHPDKQRSEE